MIVPILYESSQIPQYGKLVLNFLKLIKTMVGFNKSLPR